MERKLNGNYLRLISGLCVEENDLGKFKMAAGDVISIRGQVMEYTNIPTGIKRELVRFGVVCDWKGKLSALLEEDRWPFILVEIDMLMCISLSTRNLITLIVLFKLGASM